MYAKHSKPALTSSLRLALLGSVVSLAIAGFFRTEARADCVELSGVVNCTGFVNGGCTNLPGTSLVVNVQSGATLEGNVSITGPGNNDLNNYG